MAAMRRGRQNPLLKHLPLYGTAVLLSLATWSSVTNSSRMLQVQLLSVPTQNDCNKPLCRLDDVSRPCKDFLPTDKFLYPVGGLHNQSLNIHLPLPIKILHEYIQEHSVTALKRDPHPELRKYAIAVYQCPHRAGNNLHRFWNHVLWAILTNRTVLWKYWTKELCINYGLTDCYETFNTESECNDILVRAPWIASYEEWKERIQPQEPAKPSSSDEITFKVPDHVTLGDVMELNSAGPLPKNYMDDYGLDLVDKYPQQVVWLALCYTKFWQLENITLQEALLKTPRARSVVHGLFSLGSDFLYGMLHRYTFQFSKPIRASIQDILDRDDSQLYTIGLHSRHRFEALDGCDIDREISCLERLIHRREDKSLSVQVRLMSDRPCTITNLTSWLTQNNYSVVTVPHEETNYGDVLEHGPFAGAAFFNDLALVTSARNAFVGMRRSSSDLPRELVVFRQIMQFWKEGVDIYQMNGTGVDMCQLPYQPDPTAPLLMDPEMALEVDR
jgi:hypothetical protein